MEDKPTLLQIATTNPNFSVLAGVVGYLDAELDAGLVAALSGKSMLTVFAPTNDAFGQLAKDLHFTGDPADSGDVLDFFTNSFKVDPQTLLTVVTYHVSPGAQDAGTIINAANLDQNVTTLATGEGGNLEIDLSNFVPGLSLGDLDPDATDPTVVLPDQFASNGVIHVIDTVLRPINLEPAPELPTITDTVLALSGTEGFDDNAGDFDFLREAVLATGLNIDLSADFADLTVFAPTDAAFMNLTKVLGFEGEGEADSFDYLLDALRLLNGGEDAGELLSAVLDYHLSDGNQSFAEIASNGVVETRLGETTLTLDGLLLEDEEPGVADPRLLQPEGLVDVKASNGVIHVIDGVLLPLDLLKSDGSNDVDFIIGDDSRERINTGRDNDFIDAKGGRDIVNSGSGDDVVLAGGGNDFVRSGSGDDTVKGEDGNDRINSGRGDDLVDGGEGNDRISAGRDDDYVYGGKGNDWISGGSGNDTINGGEGDDWLIGGSGHDTFVFEENGGHDTISFFLRGQDKIDLTAFGIEDFHDIDVDRKGFFRSEIDLGDTQITVTHSFFGLDEGDFIF